MKRVFNFSPGPAMLPEPVLKRAQAELLDWRGSGMSVMEVSHRGTDFIELAAQSERDLRALLEVPANYKVRRCNSQPFRSTSRPRARSPITS